MGKYIKWIDVLSFILFILAVYFILTRIFGHSATDLTITVTLFGGLGVLLYKLNREFGEFKVETINSFRRSKEDMTELKSDVKILKSDVNELKNKFQTMENKLDSINLKIGKLAK